MFEINDIGEWLQAVYLQVDSYWLSNEDYVGCIVCLDKVNYSGGKILETNSIEIDTYLKKYFGFSLGLVQLKGENIQFIIYPKANDFYGSLERSLLSKPCLYSDESEVRLIVTPLFSNMSEDGFILNHANNEMLIEMELGSGLTQLATKIF